MARLRFHNSTNDAVKKLFVKKKTFKLSVGINLILLSILLAFGYKLYQLGELKPLFTKLTTIK